VINNVYVYHFTKKENVDSILHNGLKHGTKYNTLGSQLRIGANYFWFSPEHDLMNCKSNKDYECLQIYIDSNYCIIGNMDLISSAFVNFMLEKKNESVYDYRKLVALFDSSAIKYDYYENGLFRAPEIIIQQEISPDYIKVIDPLEISGSFPNNREIYNEKLKHKLQDLTPPDVHHSNIYSMIEYLNEKDVIKKVALHDDAVGLLQSYIINDNHEFFTIELSCNKESNNYINEYITIE